MMKKSAPKYAIRPGVEQRVVETERLRVGQVEDAVVDGDVAVRADDLVAAEQEAERDEQTARGHERDHVGDAGHQHPAGAAAPRLLAAGARRRHRRRRFPRPAGRSGRRRTGAPRRSSRRRRRSAASRWRRPSACRRSGTGRARPRPRRRSPPRPGRSCRAPGAWTPPSPGSRPRARRRRPRPPARAPRRPCRCGRCRSGTRSPRPGSSTPPASGLVGCLRVHRRGRPGARTAAARRRLPEGRPRAPR